jgi:hypothetical protein
MSGSSRNRRIRLLLLLLLPTTYDYYYFFNNNNYLCLIDGNVVDNVSTHELFCLGIILIMV